VGSPDTVPAYDASAAFGRIAHFSLEVMPTLLVMTARVAPETRSSPQSSRVLCAKTLGE
jgi:hypothetical protein